MFGGKDQRWTSFSISASHECRGAPNLHLVCGVSGGFSDLASELSRACWADYTLWLFTTEEGGGAAG